MQALLVTKSSGLRGTACSGSSDHEGTTADKSMARKARRLTNSSGQEATIGDEE